MQEASGNNGNMEGGDISRNEMDRSLGELVHEDRSGRKGQSQH